MFWSLYDCKIVLAAGKAHANEKEDIRAYLRGFCRTILSFLMAYGTEKTTLEDSDTIVPDLVLKK